MPNEVRLDARRRTVLGKKVKQLRHQGVLPGNIYGHGRESVPVQLDAHDMDRALKTHGPAQLYRLVLAPDGVEDTALVRHIERDPVSHAMQHIDFLHVEMSEPITAKIPIRLLGDAPVVTQQDGILVHVMDAVEVEALPSDLPDFVEVDVSDMQLMNETRYARDVKVPPRVTLLTPALEIVVTVTPPKVTPTESVMPESMTVETGEQPAPAEDEAPVAKE